ncbi:MAG: TlyA family RNA methyltransferase [Coriobacteriia bacterium]|nr:TlyA family RNA methyltransferase [Coriobacteriia bacterium]
MSSRDKVRLTELLVLQGFCASTDEAERRIRAGEVLGDDICLTQPALLVDPQTHIRMKAHSRYVSRGGDKLAGALADFCFDPRGLRCLDVGASTGGFTDCLLQRGAAQVVAVDVAYGQFAWQLRQDGRVTVFERTNIRELDPALADAPFDLVVCDLSFTSLRSALPVLLPFLGEAGVLIALVKPQFELAPELVGRGVVTAPAAHQQALEQVLEAALTVGLAPQALTFSPLAGQKGNIEFFLLAHHSGIPVTIDVPTVVHQAHKRLAR